ncbi:MAG: flagellin lysine-N-methylase [Lachnospiraceae bacterium]
MTIKVRVPHYYDTFHCTGSNCPDTCCIGWMIEIDDPSYQRFMSMQGEFGERIRKNIIERPDGHFFALNENGRCTFLNQDNLCEMVIQMGDESLCSLCDNYPRVGVEYGALREMGLSFSCPEVAKLILSSSKPIRFGEWNQEEDIDGVDYTRDRTFIALMDLRDVVFGILQNREISIGHRCALYLMLASRLQNVIDDDTLVGEDGTRNKIDQIHCIIKDFSDDTYLQRMIKAIKMGDAQNSKKNLIRMMEFVGGLEIINRKWIHLYEKTKDFLDHTDVEQWMEDNKQFGEYYKENDYVYEHLMVYYVYRYFMKMVFDGDIYSKAVMSLVALILIRQMNLATWNGAQNSWGMDNQITIMYLYSKEIEHCEENMERLAEEFWDNDLYQPKSLIDIITNIL